MWHQTNLQIRKPQVTRAKKLIQVAWRRNATLHDKMKIAFCLTWIHVVRFDLKISETGGKKGIKQ